MNRSPEKLTDTAVFSVTHTRPIPSRFPATMADEVIFLMNNKLADMQVRCVMSFDGRIDEERLARAVRLTLDAEPILGCRFVEHWLRPYWERRNDLDHLTPCTVVNVSDTSQELARVMSTPLDPLHDPLINVHLLRSETDVLCLRINHVATDAGGGKEYAYLLASTYRKLAENPRYVPEHAPPTLRSLRQISRQFSISEKFKIIRSGFHSHQRSADVEKIWSFPSNEGKLSHKTFLTHTFGPERFHAIKKYGYAHQATVNDIMIAAFYRALFDVLKPSPQETLRMVSTIDLRRYLPSGSRAMVCNYSSLLETNIDHKYFSTFDQALVKIREEMNTLKEDYAGLLTIPFAALFLKGLPYFWVKRWLGHALDQRSENRMAPPIFTNTGIFDSARLVFGDTTVTEAYILAATVAPPFLCMALSSFNESLTLSVSFYESALGKDVVEDIFEKMGRELPE